MTLDELRRLSGALFGHRYRLELVAALSLAPREGICVTALAATRGVASSVFYPPLRLLVDAGLVRRLGARGGDRRVFYASTDSAAWAGLRQLVEDLGILVDLEDRVGGRVW